MCRHLGYLGPPAGLHGLLYQAPYSLSRQAYAPRLQRNGRVNADGFGVGWYVDGRSEPVRYRRSQPLWTDVSFENVAQVLQTGCVVAAVRCATAGFPVEESGAQPFTVGPWLFSHNGRVDGFASIETRLRELAGDAVTAPDARAAVDSALLFAIAVGQWRAGASLADGLAYVVDRVTGLGAPAPGRLNLLASNGRELAATAFGDTLFVREADHAVVVASEPYDDEPGWRPVPQGSLVTASNAGIRITPLRRPSS
ncbi:MAG: ergothioneine biosynthesis protein EgtC [Streptosporangiales bacterium]|nr:ergothioneine biosynthesis protein EgtC [Streptosporangiales bacterium]